MNETHENQGAPEHGGATVAPPTSRRELSRRRREAANRRARRVGLGAAVAALLGAGLVVAWPHLGGPDSTPATPAGGPTPGSSASPTPGGTATPSPSASTPATGPAAPKAAAGSFVTAVDASLARSLPGALVMTAGTGEDVITGPVEVVLAGRGGERRETSLPPAMRASLVAGKVTSASPLPRTSGTGTITRGRARQKVPTLSPAATLVQLQRPAAACKECEPLVVRRAAPATMTLATTGGAVVVPAWEFTLRDSPVRIVRAAFDSTMLVRIDSGYRGELEASRVRDLVPVQKVSVGKDGRSVVARVADGKRPTMGCVRMGAVESQHSVALFAGDDTSLGKPSAATKCAGEDGVLRTTLAAPLGDRLLLDTYWQRALKTG